MLFLEKSRKWERWEGKGMLFHQADQEPLSSEENKSIPFGLKQGRRYAFFRKKPQMGALGGERYAFSPG